MNRKGNRDLDPQCISVLNALYKDSALDSEEEKNETWFKFTDDTFTYSNLKDHEVNRFRVVGL